MPILEAAIETKTHYLDICDDWEPTEKMFLLNDEDPDLTKRPFAAFREIAKIDSAAFKKFSET